MAKIIVGFSNRQALSKISAALERSGFSVFRQCLTGNEVMRAFSLCQDGVLVCGARFPDRTADQIAEDLDSRAVILVADRPERLEMCEHTEIAKLAMPFSLSELTRAVEERVAEHDARMPRRSEADRETVERAKERLMLEHGLTEAEAHRHMQRLSMQRGIKMAECARRILEEKSSGSI